MTDASREELRADLLSRIPRWYSPWLHLAFPALAGIAIVAFALSLVSDLRTWQLAYVPLFLEALYVRHTPQHHGVYVADDMFIRDWRELKLILLPAWGVLAIIAASSPVALALAVLGQRNLAALWVASAVVYVLSYEWLHLAYHLPAEGAIGRLRVTRWLRQHHQRHHAPQLMQRWNFNVTLPLWDHVRGTVWHATDQAPAPALPRRA